MPRWQTIGAENMLTDGSMREINLHDTKLLIARVQGSYYAVQARCPHMGGELARGKLDEFIVRCPRHGSLFDLRDGHVVDWITKIPGIARTLAQAAKKPRGLRTYPTKVEDGQVWVQTDSASGAEGSIRP